MAALPWKPARDGLAWPSCSRTSFAVSNSFMFFEKLMACGPSLKYARVGRVDSIPAPGHASIQAPPLRCPAPRALHDRCSAANHATGQRVEPPNLGVFSMMRALPQVVALAQRRPNRRRYQLH